MSNHTVPDGKARTYQAMVNEDYELDNGFLPNKAFRFL